VRDLGDDRGLIGPKVLSVGSASAAVAGAALQRDRRQQAAFGDADRGRGDVDVEAGGHHRRMLLEGQRGRVLAAARQIAVDGFGGRNCAGALPITWV
jgi:hypothetical protein